MVAIQGEVVTRIDADTEEIATNVSGAQSCVEFQLRRGTVGVLVTDARLTLQRTASLLRLCLIESMVDA